MNLSHQLEQLQDEIKALRASIHTTTHHINQHLTVIMGEAQLLQDELDSSAEAQESLERIITATEHARKKLSGMCQNLVELQRHAGQNASSERIA